MSYWLMKEGFMGVYTHPLIDFLSSGFVLQDAKKIFANVIKTISGDFDSNLSFFRLVEGRLHGE